jgi:ketosteroid isomerase-like protein
MADVDDLKATHAQQLEALHRRDLDAYMAFWHDQVVDFGPASAPFPTDGKAAFRQGMQAAFDTHESILVTPINTQFRVIGTTGVVWGHYAIALKPKDGPARTEFGRYSLAYVVATNFFRPLQGVAKWGRSSHPLPTSA